MHLGLSQLPVSVLAIIWSYVHDAPTNYAQHGNWLWQVVSLLPPTAFAAVIDHLPASTVQALRRSCRAMHFMLSHHNMRLVLPDDYEGTLLQLLQPLTAISYPNVRNLEFGTVSDVYLSTQPAVPAPPHLVNIHPAPPPAPLVVTVSFFSQITQLICHCHLDSQLLLDMFVQLISITPHLQALDYDLILDPGSDDAAGNLQRLNLALLPHLPPACPRLRSLTLPHLCRSESFSAQNLAALVALTHLTRLHLHYVDPLDPEEAQAVALSLLPLTNLVSLALPLPIATSLFTFLPQPITPLTFLKLTETSAAAAPPLPTFPTNPPPFALHLLGPSVLPPIIPHANRLTSLRNLTLAQLHLNDSDLLLLEGMSLLTSLSILPLTASPQVFTGCHLSRLCSPAFLQSLALRVSAFHPSVPPAICRFSRLTHLVYLYPQQPSSQPQLLSSQQPADPGTGVAVSAEPTPGSSNSGGVEIDGPWMLSALDVGASMDVTNAEPSIADAAGTGVTNAASSMPGASNTTVVAVEDGHLPQYPMSADDGLAHPPTVVDEGPSTPHLMLARSNVPSINLGSITRQAPDPFESWQTSLVQLAKLHNLQLPLLSDTGSLAVAANERAGSSGATTSNPRPSSLPPTVTEGVTSRKELPRGSSAPLEKLCVSQLRLTPRLLTCNASVMQLTQLRVTGKLAMLTDRTSLSVLPYLAPRLRVLKVSCAASVDDLVLKGLCAQCASLRKLDLGYLRAVTEEAAEQLTSLVQLTRLWLMFDRRAPVNCDRLRHLLGMHIERASVEM